MRIGIDGRSLEGGRTGVARYLLALLRVWATTHRTHEYYLYFESRLPTDPLLDETCFTKRLPARLPLRKHNVRQLLWEQTILPFALKRDQIDLFFSPGYTMPFAFRGRSVVTIHDVSYEAHPEWSRPPQRWKLKALSAAASRNASAILTDSEFSRAELVKYYKLDHAKITVIPLAADSKMRPLPKDRVRILLAEQYQIHSDYLLYVGSVFYRRHVPTLINAFRLVCKQFRQHQLVIVGHDCRRATPGIRQMVAAVNRDEGKDLIRYFENVPDDALPYLYSGASLFVYLSEYEGFGLPPLEALACGLPVVSSNMASLPEVLGDAAIPVTDPTDEAVVALAIATGLGDERLRTDLKARGLVQAGRFSWERCARDTMKVMEEVYATCYSPCR